MPKPICVECEVEFVPYKCGIIIAEMFQGNKIYKIWSADEWECPRCHKKIVNRYGDRPICEHFQKDEIKKWENDITVRAFETVGEAEDFGGVKEK